MREYGQSAIDDLTDYENDISDAEKKTEYTFYQDHFGYIRIFAYPAEIEDNYLLLTKGRYAEKRTNDEYAVKAYLDGEISEFDVNEKGPVASSPMKAPSTTAGNSGRLQRV